MLKKCESFETDPSVLISITNNPYGADMMTSSNGNIFRVTGHLCGASHKGQRHGALMFSLICAWKNGWVNNREAGDLRRQLAHYDVIVMDTKISRSTSSTLWLLIVFVRLENLFLFFQGRVQISMPPWLRGTIENANMCFMLLLSWRHNERDGVSNHQRLDCLLNRLFGSRSKETSKIRITGLNEGN